MLPEDMFKFFNTIFITIFVIAIIFFIVVIIIVLKLIRSNVNARSQKEGWVKFNRFEKRAEEALMKGALYCKYCGAKVEPEEEICHSCGENIDV